MPDKLRWRGSAWARRWREFFRQPRDRGAARWHADSLTLGWQRARAGARAILPSAADRGRGLRVKRGGTIQCRPQQSVSDGVNRCQRVLAGPCEYIRPQWCIGLDPQNQKDDVARGFVRRRWVWRYRFQSRGTWPLDRK